MCSSRPLLALALVLAVFATAGPAGAQPKEKEKEARGEQGPPADRGGGRPEREPEAAPAPSPAPEPSARPAEQSKPEPARAEAAAAPGASEPAAESEPAAADAPTAAPAQPSPTFTASRPADAVARSAGVAAAPATAAARRRAERPAARRRASVPPRAASQAGSGGPVARERPVDPLVTATRAPRENREARQRSTLHRTVVRVVDVIPASVRRLIALLAAAALLLGLVAATVTVRARRLRRQRDRLAADVGELRAALQPALPDRVGPATVTLTGAAQDGDFHDVIRLPGDRTGVVLGGGAGLDLPLATLVRYTLRGHLERGLEPRDALDAAARGLFEELDGRHVRAVVAVYDSLTGHLTFACAGHPEPAVHGADAPGPIGRGAPALGAGLSAGAQQVTLPLPPGAEADFAGRLRLRPLDGAAAPAARRTDELRVRAHDLVQLSDLLPVGTDRAGAVRAARRLIGRHGVAHVEIRRGDDRAQVRVSAATDGEPVFSSREAPALVAAA